MIFFRRISLLAAALIVYTGCGDSGSVSDILNGDGTSVIDTTKNDVSTDRDAALNKSAVLYALVGQQQKVLAGYTFFPFASKVITASISTADIPLLSEQTLTYTADFLPSSSQYITYNHESTVEAMNENSLPNTISKSFDSPAVESDNFLCPNGKTVVDVDIANYDNGVKFDIIDNKTIYEGCEVNQHTTHFLSTDTKRSLWYDNNRMGSLSIYEWKLEDINAEFNSQSAIVNKDTVIDMQWKNSYGYWVDVNTMTYTNYFDYTMMVDVLGIIVRVETVTPLKGDALTGVIQNSTSANQFNVYRGTKLAGSVSFRDEGYHVVLEPDSTVLEIPYNKLAIEAGGTIADIFTMK